MPTKPRPQAPDAAQHPQTENTSLLPPAGTWLTEAEGLIVVAGRGILVVPSWVAGALRPPTKPWLIGWHNPESGEALIYLQDNGLIRSLGEVAWAGTVPQAINEMQIGREVHRLAREPRFVA